MRAAVFRRKAQQRTEIPDQHPFTPRAADGPRSLYFGRDDRRMDGDSLCHPDRRLPQWRDRGAFARRNHSSPRQHRAFVFAAHAEFKDLSK